MKSSNSGDESGPAGIGEPFRELMELLRHAEQSAIGCLQALIRRCLEAIQLVALLRIQASAPALSDQIGAALVRFTPRLFLSDPVQRMAKEFARDLFGGDGLCGSPSPQLCGQGLVEGNGQVHGLLSWLWRPLDGIV